MVDNHALHYQLLLFTQVALQLLQGLHGLMPAPQHSFICTRYSWLESSSGLLCRSLAMQDVY